LELQPGLLGIRAQPLPDARAAHCTERLACLAKGDHERSGVIRADADEAGTVAGDSLTDVAQHQLDQGVHPGGTENGPIQFREHLQHVEFVPQIA